MKIEFTPSFKKDIKRLRDGAMCARLEKTVEALEQAVSLDAVPQLKKLAASSNCYRIRIGDYRLGLQTDGKVMLLVRFLHRRDIYRSFP